MFGYAYVISIHSIKQHRYEMFVKNLQLQPLPLHHHLHLLGKNQT